MSAIAEDEFRKAVLASHKPVLVHFADGEASRRLGPVLDRLADRLDGRSRVARIELGANSELAARYGVFAPALVYFKNGSVAGRRPAGGETDALYDWLEGMGIGCACHPD